MIRLLVYTLAALLVLGIGISVLVLGNADPNTPPMRVSVDPPDWVGAVEDVTFKNRDCTITYKGKKYGVHGVTALGDGLNAKSDSAGTGTCLIHNHQAECKWRRPSRIGKEHHYIARQGEFVGCEKDNPAYYDYQVKKSGKVKF